MMLPMVDATIQALGWALLHFLWQGAAVAGVLVLARGVMRRAPLRHVISVAALMACAGLPVATFMLHLPAQVRAPMSAVPAIEASPAASITPSIAPQRPVGLKMSAADFQSAAPRNTPLTMLQRYTPVIVLLWIVGVSIMAARLVSSCWATRRLRRVGTSPLPEQWRARVRQLTQELGLRRGVQVVTSSLATVPMVVGVLRPIVLVPVATLFGLTQQQLETILIHELEHVRRYDGCVIVVQRLVETLLFYHPAVWWISACVQREREHCCDDAVARRTDAHLYVRALATLEELRAPALAAASTDGPLLARVRRLIAPASMAGSTRITPSTVIATMALISLTAAAFGLIATATAEDNMESVDLPGVVLHGPRVPTLQDLPSLEAGRWSGANMGGSLAFSTIVDAYVAALSYGGDERSATFVAATFGHPFHFVMKAGAVWHDHNCNIDTWNFFNRLTDLGWETVNISEFTGAGNEPNAEALHAAREEAWEAVTASIDRGIPAIAWSPNAEFDYAGWGLLLGYDAATRSYHVSHVKTDSVYSVPFDGFGGGWFSVLVLTERSGVDLRVAEITTLRHAVEYSKGLRYTVEDSKNCCAVDAIGFDAYQLWIDALAAGEIDPKAVRSHAWQLMHTRHLAAEYTREAAERFGGAVGARLARATEHYVHQSESARQLLHMVTPWSTTAPTPAEMEEARELVDLMLRQEKGAVMFLEAALLSLGEQIPGEPTSPDVATLQSEPTAKVDVDVRPIEPDRKTTLASSLGPVLHTLGRQGWTPARVQGVLGHLFHFQMAEGGEVVYHDNLDWSLALKVLPEVATYRTYDTTAEVSKEVRARTVEDARDAVRQSLERGVPALAWNPRSKQQHDNRHPARGGLCWGLIVGYDDEQQSYTIRHPFVWQGDYTVRYDEIGQWNGNEWFSVMVFDDVKSADDEALHRMALRNAISFADGTRLGKHKWAQGLAALELWLAAFESPDMPGFTHFHARVLGWRKELAAQYMRDLAGIFEEAREPLELAADRYDREHELAEALVLLVEPASVHGYSDADLAEARRLLSELLAHERAAVEQIRVALRALGEEVPAAGSPARQENTMDVAVDVTPTRPNNHTSLAASLDPLLEAAGHGEWSMAGLQGVMGHAFQFQMAPDGGSHMHDNLDWSIALEAIPQIGTFTSFETHKGDEDIDDLWAYKGEARDAVRQSLARGLPVLVWQPMSREQQADKNHPGHTAYCWGLVVGYDEADEEYTIRHPFVQQTYTVRYDSIGHSDGHEWFHLKIWEGDSAAPAEEIHREALRHAVEFAKGTRFSDENWIRADGRQVRPYGFAAYETWHEALDAPDVEVHHSVYHTRMLRDRRQAAAAYMRELVDILPAAAGPLEAAAAHYDRELEAVGPLFALFDAAAHAGRPMEGSERAELQRLISVALEADRAAVAQIEVALAQLQAQ